MVVTVEGQRRGHGASCRSARVRECVWVSFNERGWVGCWVQMKTFLEGAQFIARFEVMHLARCITITVSELRSGLGLGPKLNINPS